MRTLLLNDLFAPVRGGVQTYMSEVCEALGPRGLVVVAPRSAGDAAHDRALAYPVVRYEQRSREEGYPALWRSVRRRLGGAPRAGGRLRRGTVAALGVNRNLLRKVADQSAALPAVGLDAVDLVVAGTVFPSGVSALLLRERLGLPYVVVTHAAEIAGPRGRQRWLLRRVLRRAERVVAVSRFTAGLARGLGVADERIRRVPPGIDARPFLVPHDESAARLARDFGVAGRRVVLTHGRLVARKGHDMVLRSLPRLLEKVPDAAYLVTGEGEMERALRALARELGVARHVVFGGEVAPRDLPALYQLCDVFVMASRRIGASVEGFGIVYLEAGAAGKPVVGGASGGTADAVADGATGWIVDPEDPGAIADAIAGTLADPGLAARLGDAGRRRVLAEFDREAFGRRFRAALAGVAGPVGYVAGPVG